MDLIEELGKAIDPEAFETDTWNHPDHDEAVRLGERRRDVTERIVTGLGKLGDHYKIVPLDIPSFDGDYYMLDGYGQGRKAALYLNEKRLGAFLVTLLKLGGSVVSISAFDARYKDCHVSAVVKLHPDRKAEFEAATGVTLKAPSRLVPA